MHSQEPIEEMKRRARKKLCDFYIQDCLQNPSMINHLHQFVEFLDTRVEELCQQELHDKKWHKRFEQLSKKINSANVSIPSNDGSLREAVISISTLSSQDDIQHSTHLGMVSIVIEEPTISNVKLIASIGAVIYSVLDEIKIPDNGRVQFSLEGRTVLFAGEHNDDIVIDLSKHLLGCGAQ